MVTQDAPKEVGSPFWDQRIISVDDIAVETELGMSFRRILVQQRRLVE